LAKEPQEYYCSFAKFYKKAEEGFSFLQVQGKFCLKGWLS